MKKILLIVFIALTFVGCNGINPAIAKYKKVANQVDLGDSKEKVLAILLPTQEGLCGSCGKAPTKYIKDGVKTEIYYMRTLRQPDGLTTDDEFTPYVFKSNKLVAIGWETLNVSKSQGQVVPINNTSVNVQQKTIVY